MFVTERVAPFSCATAGSCSLDLAWGVHPDINSCDSEHPCDATSPFATCASSGANTGHCVDTSGNQPTVTDALPFGLSTTPNAGQMHIRLISKELLKGSTLEDFMCACNASVCTNPATGLLAANHACIATSNCAGGANVTNDPVGCGGCGDDPTTTDRDETNKCLDLNQDGNPDGEVMKAGAVHIACGAFSYDTGQFDGYYNPSGTQLIPSLGGLEGLGPAIQLQLVTPLPTDRDCTITMGASVTDKDGNAFAAPTSPMTFHTEALGLLNDRLTPRKAATNVSKGPAGCSATPTAANHCTQLVVGFNTIVAPASVAGNDEITVAPTAGGANVAGTVTRSATGTSLLWTAGAQLTPSTSYTVTVHNTSGTAANAIQDLYGGTLGANITYTFTTGT